MPNDTDFNRGTHGDSLLILSGLPGLSRKPLPLGTGYVTHDLNYYRKIQGVNDASTAKEAELRLIQSELLRDFENTLDCEDVKVNGVDTKLLITKATDLTIKNVSTKPNATIDLGDIVTWSNTNWILDTIDADTRINTKGKIRRCNTTLRWRDEKGTAHSYPAFCEDATKYSEGVSGGKMMEVPDFQIKAKIRLDANSAKLNRNKRFLLDAELYLPQIEASGNHVSAFKVTRRNVITGNQAGHGYVELTMVECAYSDRDNPNLMIADYYDAEDEYEIATNVDEIVVAKGTQFTLVATATKNGAAIDQTSILFQTSDAGIATVSPSGVVRGVGNGTCVVTVKAGTARKEIATRVEASSATPSIKIFSDNDTILYGQTKRIDFKAYLNGAETATTFSTSISNATAATIVESGSGFIVIRATDDGELVGTTFTLTVSSASLSATATKDFKIGGWF